MAVEAISNSTSTDKKKKKKKAADVEVINSWG